MRIIIQEIKKIYLHIISKKWTIIDYFTNKKIDPR